MKKRLAGVLLMFLVVMSTFTLAEDTTVNECGLWCKVSQFLFGNPQNRVGAGWFDRGEALVGESLYSNSLENDKKLAVNNANTAGLVNPVAFVDNKNNVWAGNCNGEDCKSGAILCNPQKCLVLTQDLTWSSFMTPKDAAASSASILSKPQEPETPISENGWECTSSSCKCVNDNGCYYDNGVIVEKAEYTDMNSNLFSPSEVPTPPKKLTLTNNYFLLPDETTFVQVYNIDDLDYIQDGDSYTFVSVEHQTATLVGKDKQGDPILLTKEQKYIKPSGEEYTGEIKIYGMTHHVKEGVIGGGNVEIIATIECKSGSKDCFVKADGYEAQKCDGTTTQCESIRAEIETGKPSSDWGAGESTVDTKVDTKSYVCNNKGGCYFGGNFFPNGDRIECDSSGGNCMCKQGTCLKSTTKAPSGISSAAKQAVKVNPDGSITVGNSIYNPKTINRGGKDITIYCHTTTKACFKKEGDAWYQVDPKTGAYCAKGSENCDKKSDTKDGAEQSTKLPKDMKVDKDGKAVVPIPAAAPGATPAAAQPVEEPKKNTGLGAIFGVDEKPIATMTAADKTAQQQLGQLQTQQAAFEKKQNVNSKLDAQIGELDRQIETQDNVLSIVSKMTQTASQIVSTTVTDSSELQIVTQLFDDPQITTKDQFKTEWDQKWTVPKPLPNGIDEIYKARTAKQEAEDKKAQLEQQKTALQSLKDGIVPADAQAQSLLAQSLGYDSLNNFITENNIPQIKTLTGQKGWTVSQPSDDIIEFKMAHENHVDQFSYIKSTDTIDGKQLYYYKDAVGTEHKDALIDLDGNQYQKAPDGTITLKPDKNIFFTSVSAVDYRSLVSTLQEKLPDIKDATDQSAQIKALQSQIKTIVPPAECNPPTCILQTETIDGIEQLVKYFTQDGITYQAVGDTVRGTLILPEEVSLEQIKSGEQYNDIAIINYVQDGKDMTLVGQKSGETANSNPVPTSLYQELTNKDEMPITGVGDTGTITSTKGDITKTLEKTKDAGYLIKAPTKPAEKDKPAESSFTKYDPNGAGLFSYTDTSQKTGEVNMLLGNAGTVYVNPEDKDLQNKGLTTDLLFSKTKEGQEKEKWTGKIGKDEVSGGTATTDFEDEFQYVLRPDGTLEQRSIDYYDETDSGCSKDYQCIKPTEGAILDKNGNPTELTNYQYTGTGADKDLERTELFNPSTGRFEGVIMPDGTKIEADKKDGEYTGTFTIKDKNGNDLGHIGTDGKCVEKSGDSLAACAGAYKQASNIKSYTSGDFWSPGGAQTTIESIYALTNSIKSYPALSSLMEDITGTKWNNWLFDADKTFAPMLGTNWFPSGVCDLMGYRERDLISEGKAVIKTSSGTYQAVASIQLERSQNKQPLLCEPNPDPEAEEQFICEYGQVCLNDLCYLDKDLDQEPDEEKPLEGYFYKITWGVSAPQDEAFTPYVDEDGVSVSFNIYLDTGDNGEIDSNAIPLYSKDGDIVAPIKLKNGASDRDVFFKYSNTVYNEACIGWNQAPSTTMGQFTGTETIGDVCFSVDITTEPGIVKSYGAEKSAASESSTVSEGEVTKNTNW